MTTRIATQAATLAGLCFAPLALAHGPHSADITLYHYFSSPDHVLNLFGVAALTVLTIAWAARRAAAPARRKKP